MTIVKKCRRAYTADEDAAIREMVADGETDVAIGVALGRSVRSVASRRRVLRRSNRWDARYLKKRMAGPPLKTDKRLRVLNLLERGLSINKIAQLLGTTSSPLCRFLQRMAKDRLVRRVEYPAVRVRWEVLKHTDSTE